MDLWLRCGGGLGVILLAIYLLIHLWRKEPKGRPGLVVVVGVMVYFGVELMWPLWGTLGGR